MCGAYEKSITECTYAVHHGILVWCDCVCDALNVKRTHVLLLLLLLLEVLMHSSGRAGAAIRPIVSGTASAGFTHRLLYNNAMVAGLSGW